MKVENKRKLIIAIIAFVALACTALMASALTDRMQNILPLVIYVILAFIAIKKTFIYIIEGNEQQRDAQPNLDEMTERSTSVSINSSAHTGRIQIMSRKARDFLIMTMVLIVIIILGLFAHFLWARYITKPIFDIFD